MRILQVVAKGLFLFRHRLGRVQDFLRGRTFRLVEAKSSSCFLLMDLAICRDAPLSEDLLRSPRFAARAAPAAICCFLDFAGIPVLIRGSGRCRSWERMKDEDQRGIWALLKASRRASSPSTASETPVCTTFSVCCWWARCQAALEAARALAQGSFGDV